MVFHFGGEVHYTRTAGRSFGFPMGLKETSTPKHCGIDVVIVYAPDTEFEGTIAGCCDSWISTFDVGELADACESLAECDFGSVIQGHTAIQLDLNLRLRLHAFSRELASVTEATPAVLQDARVQEALHAKLTVFHLSRSDIRFIEERLSHSDGRALHRNRTSS